MSQVGEESAPPVPDLEAQIGVDGRNLHRSFSDPVLRRQRDWPRPPPVLDADPGAEPPLDGSLRWAPAIFMAFQHCLVIIGQLVLLANVLVPLMGGGNNEKAKVILSTLFVSGLITLLQSLLGTLLPVVMGSSFSYVIPAMAISQKFNHEESPERFGHSMRTFQGTLMMAALFQLVIASFGVAKFGRLLSPLTTAPLVILTGFGFLSSGFPKMLLCSEVSFPVLITLIVLLLILPYILLLIARSQLHRSVASRTRLARLGIQLRRFGVLLSVGWLWLVAHILSITHAYHHRAPEAQIYCRTERSGLLTSAPGIWFPLPFQWGSPNVDFRNLFTMMTAALVSTIECSGGFIASSRLSGATPIPPFILRRGAIVQGIGSFLSAMFGTVTGCTISLENVGLTGATRVASRDVTPMVALWMIFFSLLGKVGAFFAAVPFPVIAAWYCILDSHVGFLQYCNLNNRRNMFIVGFSTVMGITVPFYYRDLQPSTAVSDIVLVFCASPATIGVFTAVLLDQLMPRDESDHLGLDSGMQWFQDFWEFGIDCRTAIHYSRRFYLQRLFHV